MICMADFKIVISDPKTGKSYQKELKDPDSKNLFGMKIGDTVKGELFGLTGYEMMITGGSDNCGFPMRRDVIGTPRKRILSTKGSGVRDIEYGDRKRKSVAGNTIFDLTAQVNLKVTKQGKEPMEPKAEKAEDAKEEKAAPAKEAPAEAKVEKHAGKDVKGDHHKHEKKAEEKTPEDKQ